LQKSEPRKRGKVRGKGRHWWPRAACKLEKRWGGSSRFLTGGLDDLAGGRKEQKKGKRKRLTTREGRHRHSGGPTDKESDTIKVAKAHVC